MSNILITAPIIETDGFKKIDIYKVKYGFTDHPDIRTKKMTMMSLPLDDAKTKINDNKNTNDKEDPTVINRNLQDVHENNPLELTVNALNESGVDTTSSIEPESKIALTPTEPGSNNAPSSIENDLQKVNDYATNIKNLTDDAIKKRDAAVEINGQIKSDSVNNTEENQNKMTELYSKALELIQNAKQIQGDAILIFEKYPDDNRFINVKKDIDTQITTAEKTIENTKFSGGGKTRSRRQDMRKNKTRKSQNQQKTRRRKDKKDRRRRTSRR